MHALLYKFMEVTDYETNIDVLLKSFANVYFLCGFEDCSFQFQTIPSAHVN